VAVRAAELVMADSPDMPGTARLAGIMDNPAVFITRSISRRQASPAGRTLWSPSGGASAGSSAGGAVEGAAEPETAPNADAPDLRRRRRRIGFTGSRQARLP